MNATRCLLCSFLLAAAAPAQLGVAIASGQPVLAAIRPTLQNTLPLAIVEAAGNPQFRIHAAVVTPAVPVGAPIFLLIGWPVAAPIPLDAPLLSPAFGLPGTLAMSEIVVMAPMTVAGTYGTPPYALPIPPGLGPIGHCLTTQIAVWTAAGWGLTGATGIVI
jgi:hypothetical protein